MRNLIYTGAMSSGKKPFTLRQIAQLAGTSKSTVSRVLSDHPRISEITRQRVLKIVEENEYQPNQLARNLARGRTGLISVISTDIGSGFFAEVIKGIDQKATEKRNRLLCSFAHTPEGYLKELRTLGGGGQVEGLILVAPFTSLFKKPISFSVPIILCAARPGPQDLGWESRDSVTLDNKTAMEALLEHLSAQGFRHLIHLAGPGSNYDAVQREKAFRSGLERHPELRGEVIPCGMIREDGQRLAQELPAEKMNASTAFVAFNDSLARGFTERLRELRPNSAWPVAITGWDGSEYAEAVGLTTLSIPMHELGQVAAATLFERITPEGRAADPRHQQVPLMLCVRESSTRRSPSFPHQEE